MVLHAGSGPVPNAYTGPGPVAALVHLAAMTAGTLAITGVGIYGVFGFAGFYSKDEILWEAFASGHSEAKPKVATVTEISANTPTGA